MAWTYEQKFNELNDGDLNGQDNWAKIVGVANVGDFTPYEGAKCVKAVVNTITNNDVLYGRAITSLTAGIAYFAFKVSTVIANECFRFYFDKDAFGTGGVQFRQLANGSMVLWRVGEVTVVIPGTVANDTWVVVAVEIDIGGNGMRAKAYIGGAWGAWSNWLTGFSATYCAYCGFYFFDGNFSGYVDTITPTDPIAPAAVPKSQGHIF